MTNREIAAIIHKRARSNKESSNMIRAASRNEPDLEKREMGVQRAQIACQLAEELEALAKEFDREPTRPKF